VIATGKRLLVNGRYLPSNRAVSKPKDNRNSDLNYQAFKLNPPLSPMLYAGQGIFNYPANDVWVRDHKGRTFFVDGREWVVFLKSLASEGEGTMSSVKPEIIDLEERNESVTRQAFQHAVIIVFCALVIGGVAFALIQQRKKQTAEQIHELRT
jgi:hypothetical protein